jgi:DNA polymerase-3 subunit delta'
MPFSELIAQDRALAPLRSALRRGALHHAYLFGGPEGVGKAQAAQLLAQAANCEGPGAPGRDDPCGECGPCRKIAKGVHPDVLVLREERTMAKAGAWEPKGGRAPSKDVVVDQIRDVVDRRLSMRRFEGRRRFVVIDPADAMNVAAQNALLKTLEEPPDDTTLVLVASSPDALLPTVRSRCMRVSFAPLPPEAVAARLMPGAPGIAARRLKRLKKEAEERAEDDVPPAEDVELEVARELRIAAAVGGDGRAIAEAGSEAALAALGTAVPALAALGGDDAGEWLAWAALHGDERDTAKGVCDVVEVWLRDVVAVQAGGERLALGELAGTTRRAAAAMAPAEALRRVEQVRRCRTALRQNASPVLAMERMLIGWFDGRA